MTDREMKELKESVKRIETALCGDESAGITGIVKKVFRHEKQITALQRIVWVLTGAVTTLSIVWTVFKEIL